MNAFEIEITIQSKSGESRWPIVVRCKQPDGLIIHSKETLKLNQEDFNQLIAQSENEKEYGLLLGQALFQGAVRETFIRSLSKTTQDSHLRILLSIEVAENDPLKTLHWERLCAPIDTDGSWHLLARDQRVPFSLYIPTLIDRYFPPMGRRDLRALVLVASPTNLDKYQLAPFDVQSVLSGIQEAFGDIPYEVLANNVEVALGPPTLQELSKQLTNAQKPYTLLHFVCHGKLLNNGETVLYWATADDRVLPVAGEELLAELKNIGNNHRGLPQFTFLCSCESADPRAEGALGGLAQRLVRNLGMPAVVAMTRKVSVETALALGRSFYKRLRESGEVDVALQEATAGLGKRYDMTVPALFSRLGGRPLFSERLENRELTDEEIEYGIDKLRTLLQERAPHASVLLKKFETQVKKLKNIQGAESHTARADRIQAILELDHICDQVLDLSFDALAALGKEPPEYKAECPFPGLFSFGDKRYHKFFFGREELVKELQKELLKENFLAVIGASGSGKSSVVLAGLIPKLKEQELSLQWVYLTPGREPLKQLERRLERLLKVSEQDSILVVDQFEELFTLCEEQAERQAFIDKLFQLAEGRKVVMTMRADFLGECTFYPELRKRIETRQKLVGPMEPAELVMAMKMQADSVGLRFETGLSHAILNDVQGEPGIMPLLQYALQELWKRRRGRWLCSEEYQAIGGVQQAIAKTANDFYQSLPAFEQEQVQNIFLRLTRLDESALQGEKRRDTRRRVELEALVPTGSDLSTTKKLVQQLAGEGVRLVVTSRNESTGKEEVEVAHEALIRYWPMLQNWLNQNRSDLQLRQSINQAAEEWLHHQNQSDQDNYLIHQGGRLEDAEKLLIEPKSVRLNQEEAEYVKACGELRQRLRQQKERRKQRQLMAAASAAVVCAGFAIFAGFKWREAEIQQIQAFLQSAETSLVTHEPLDAKIGSLRAWQALKKSFWQVLWPDAELRNQVLGKLTSAMYAGQEINRLEKSHQNIFEYGVASISFTPDGRLAMVDSKGTVHLWNTKTQKLQEIQKYIHKKNSENSEFPHFNLSPDGQLLVFTKVEDSSVYLWDTKTKKLDKLEKNDGEKLFWREFTFSSHSQSLRAQSDNFAYLWDTKTKKLKNRRVINPDKEESAEFSPDGQLLVIIRDNNTVYLEDIKTKKQYEFPEKELSKDKIKVKSVRFSPDSQFLAVIPKGGFTVRLWNIKTKKWSEAFKEFYSQDGNQYSEIYSVEFSPDSQLLTITGVNGTIWLRDIKGGLLAKLQGKGSLSRVAFRQTDQLLATSDGSDIRLWDMSERRLKVMHPEGLINEIAFNPDGQRLTAVSHPLDAVSKITIHLWDTEGKNLPLPQGYQGEVTGVTFSREGQLSIATTTDKGIVRLWDDKGKSLARFSGIKGLSRFSPDGQQLAVGGDDGSVRLEDTKGNKQSLKLEGYQKGEIRNMVFSPDGQHLAVQVLDRDNRWGIWLGNTKDQQLVKLQADSLISMAFSPDSQRLVTGGLDGTIWLWETKGKPLKERFHRHKYGVVRVAFSPDGQVLVTVEGNGSLQLWSIKGQQLAELQGQPGTFTSVAFSPNGKLLATSTYDIYRRNPTLRLWQIGDMDELLRMNCDWVRDYLKNPNADLSESDRQLCEDIGTANNPGKAK